MPRFPLRFGSFCLIVLLLCAASTGVAQTPQATPDGSSPPTTPVDQLVLRIVEGGGYEYLTDTSGNPTNEEYQLVTEGEVSEEVPATARPFFSGIQNLYGTRYNLAPEGQQSGFVIGVGVENRVNTFLDAGAAADYVFGFEEVMAQQAKADPEAPQDIAPLPDVPVHDQPITGITGTVMFFDVTTGEPTSAVPFTRLIAQEGAAVASVSVAGEDSAFNDAVARELLAAQLDCIAADAPCEPIPLPAVIGDDAATPAGSPAAQDATPGTGGEVTILGPDEEYAGVTRGEWEARWWQWITSFPPEVNPSETPPGTASCGYGQSGPMFFLPSHFASSSITCVVPEGTAIFVSLGAAFCSTVEPPPFFGRNEEELRACAANVIDDVTDNQASINGEAVPDLETYRTTSPLFSLVFPADNIYELPEGVALAVTDNYSFIIAPPPPGEYVISYSWMLEGDPQPWAGTYEITVMAPQVIEPEVTPDASPEAATPVA